MNPKRKGYEISHTLVAGITITCSLKLCGDATENNGDHHCSSKDLNRTEKLLEPCLWHDVFLTR